MLVLRTSQPLCQSHPGPALLLSSIAAITITLPYRPLAGPPGLTAVPARILAALAALTAFYVITNEGPNTASHLTTRSTNPAPTVASDELIAQHTTRPAAISVLPAWQAASCSRGMPEEQARALPLQQPRPNQLICWRLGPQEPKQVLVHLQAGHCRHLQQLARGRPPRRAARSSTVARTMSGRAGSAPAASCSHRWR
jgi:hypothetical protein